MAIFDRQGFVRAIDDNEIFVFGSNLAGNHAGGAARLAHEHFGAEMGVGEGVTGQSYAFPTLTEDFQKVSSTQLHMARLKLYQTANTMPNHKFILTKVGCGIAGFDELKMQKMFSNAPSNIMKPEDWV